jgi:hypothetical protein
MGSRRLHLIDTAIPGGGVRLHASFMREFKVNGGLAAVEILQSQGRSPKDLLILQAGAEYPASATIV